jgi:uncharacterized protein (TIGR02001 family)
MKRNSWSQAALGAALLVGAPITAEAQEVEVTGNVSITSDYAFRGISQTLEKPAVQGGLDASGPFGLYLGVWGSSVNFGEDITSGPRAQVELDLYGGVATSVAGFGLDAGLLYYAYPGASDARGYDFWEAYTGLSRGMGPVTAELYGAYSPDFFAASGTGLFGSAKVGSAIPGTPLGLEASVGRQMIDDHTAFGAPDYTVWSVGASAGVFGSTIGGTVTGTDLSESDCFGGSELCRARVIVSISRGV